MCHRWCRKMSHNTEPSCRKTIERKENYKIKWSKCITGGSESSYLVCAVVFLLISPGARCSSSSLSRISKSIRWLSFWGFHSRRPWQCETTPWAEGENAAALPLMCFTSRTAVVQRFQHAHTACCPPTHDHIMTSFQSPAAGTVANLPS